MMRERSGWRELDSNHRSRGRPRRSRGIGSRLRRLSVGGESSRADMSPSRNLLSRGTDGSNPASSSSESGTNRAAAGDLRAPAAGRNRSQSDRRRVATNSRRKPMSAVGERGHAVILSYPETHSNPVSVTMPAFLGLISGEATSTGEMRPLWDNRTAICHWPCARGTRRVTKPPTQD